MTWHNFFVYGAPCAAALGVILGCLKNAIWGPRMDPPSEEPEIQPRSPYPEGDQWQMWP